MPPLTVGGRGRSSLELQASRMCCDRSPARTREDNRVWRAAQGYDETIKATRHGCGRSGQWQAVTYLALIRTTLSTCDETAGWPCLPAVATLVLFLQIIYRSRTGPRTLSTLGGELRAQGAPLEQILIYTVSAAQWCSKCLTCPREGRDIGALDTEWRISGAARSGTNFAPCNELGAAAYRSCDDQRHGKLPNHDFQNIARDSRRRSEKDGGA